jgi:fatty acid desaturase
MPRADRFADAEPEFRGQTAEGAPDHSEKPSASTAPIADFLVEFFGLVTRWFGLKWERFTLDAREQARHLFTCILLLLLAGILFLAGIILLEVVVLYLATLALGSRLGAFFLMGTIQLGVGIFLALHVRKRIGDGR